MRTDDFDFLLPEELIALRPAVPRDSARLLRVARGGALADHRVRDLPELLQPGDLLVFNTTRVLPVQLFGRRGDASIGATLHQHVGAGTWKAFVRNAKRIVPGDKVLFSADLHAIVRDKLDGGEVVLDFERSDEELMAALDAAGAMPLPPYIAGKRPADEQDRLDYQTIFAKDAGAVAAPTAGLHFTEELLDRLAGAGIRSAFVTLHVGAGTFLPVKAEDLTRHRMHAEWGEISADAAGDINRAREEGGRIIAVGTTSLRLLESAVDDNRRVGRFVGETDIFIRPGRPVRSADMLMTNFHLPKSTLFMLVAALAGLDKMRSAYAHAIARKYRFYSYGDSSLIDNESLTA